MLRAGIFIFYAHVVHGYWKVDPPSVPAEIWSNGLVPYEISNEFTSTQREKIEAAIDDLHRFSCVRFVPGQTEFGDHVFITPGERKRCSSHVGRVGIGRQTIQLAPHCFQRSTLLHELMHSLGFHHEHSRRDRDSYIRILWDNVHPNHTAHFKIQNLAQHTYGTPYDYASVMHYDSLMGTGNGKPTIMKKNLADYYQKWRFRREENMLIKRTSTLSLMDAVRLNLLYDCDISTCDNLYPHCDRYEKMGACYEAPWFMAMLCKLNCGGQC